MKGAVAPHNTRRLAPMMVIGLTLVALIAALAQRPVALLADPGHYVVRVPVAARTWQTEPTDPQWISPFGIDMYDSISDAQGLAKMRQAGASWVVTILDWSSVQPTQSGPWDWSHYDQAFADANAAGMDVCVLVTGVPEWARGSYPYPGGGPGMNVEALAGFVAAAAARYSGANPALPVVKYWTLFAEPDYGIYPPRSGEEFKGGWGKYGRDYASMIDNVRKAVKAVAPGAVVANGGVAYDAFTQESNDGCSVVLGPFNRYFMADLMRDHVSNPPMDMLAIHLYLTTFPNWTDKLSGQCGVYNSSPDATVRAAMRSLPLLVPEMGYWSAPDKGETQDQGEHRQAVHLVKMFVTGIANGVKRLAWFAVFDGDPSAPLEQHGLFRGSDLNQPKPAYWAYRTMTYELNSFSYKGMDRQDRYESYVFQRNLDGAQRMVAWANADTVPVTIKASRVSLVSMLGIASAMQASPVPQIVSDGGPGDADRSANGQVVITLTTDPVYISW